MMVDLAPGVTLGRHQEYVEQYDAALLQSIARQTAREALPINAPFGADLWTAYELSWLDAQGKPRVAVAEFSVPASSSHIVESKSLKYYLNSFSQTRFDSRDDVARVIAADLGRAAGGDVQVDLHGLEAFAHKRSQSLALGTCLLYPGPAAVAPG